MREPRRRDAVKVSPPLKGKLFISKGLEHERAREEAAGASPTGCIMQRLFEVRPFPSFLPTFRSTPSFSLVAFTLSFNVNNAAAPRLHRRRNATRAVPPLRGDLERQIFRDTKGKRFTAKWIDYSVCAEPRRATIVSPRGETRTMLGRSFALLPR